MHVVNGQIVEVRRGGGESGTRTARMADHVGSGLKPSRARVAESGTRRPDRSHLPSSSLRGTDPWTANASSVGTWDAGAALSHGPPGSGLHAPAASGAAASRWMRLVPVAGRGEIEEHRQSWNRVSSQARTGTDHQRLCNRFDGTPCSELKLDEELTMFESQIARTISNSFSNLTTRTSLSQDSLVLLTESAPVKSEAAGEKLKSSELARSSSSELKRKRSGIPEQAVQDGFGWVHPLKLLVRKALTSSDVGELGRIIIPKKDAESRLLPQLDSKEGTVLEFEDYTASKRWYFRFKYWSNNKSRMYVLENTGEFIRYHSLKEQDMLIVYEDGCKKLVVCGQKKNRSGNLDSLVEGSNLESSATAATATIATEDELSNRTTNTENSKLLLISEKS